MRSFELALLFLISGALNAQVAEDFSDGNFSRSPVWYGDTTFFDVVSGELHLNAPAISGKAWMATPSTARFKAQWEFVVQMDFNPSSSNFIKIYLTSDRPDLAGPLNGYFLMIGNTTDEVSLYRQTGSGVTKVIDGRDGALDLSAVRLRLRAATDDLGNWVVYTKTEDHLEWTLEGIARDDTHKISNWFGIMCTFTSTRSDKFHFDDFLVTGYPWPDREAPELTDFRVTAADQVLLEFDEPLLASTATDTRNFTIRESGYEILEARLLPDQQTVRLTIQSMKEGVEIQLRISGLADTSGNLFSERNITLLYLIPYDGIFHDVVFNEILSDPLPVVGLPEFEFIELLNRSSRYINLENWKVTDGSSTAILPRRILPPGEVIILSSEKAFGFSEPVITVSDFPSLNNSSDRLFVYNASEVLIDSLFYRSSWHAAEGKAEGGWSLERIDPDDFCRWEENWTSSEHPIGGTPGKQNSVLASRPDRFSPTLNDVEVLTDSVLVITFNEPLEYPLAESAVFKVTPTIRDYSSLIFTDRNQLQLSFSEKFEEKIQYTLQVTGIRDCPGNLIEPNAGRKKFFKPEMAEPLDVVLNEILFNPLPGGVDFVELFNRSDKHIRIRDWSFSNQLSETSADRKSIPTVQLPPGGYLVFTSDVDALKTFYPAIPDSVLRETELPSLPDDEGMIILSDADGKMIDAFQYSEKFHLQMIRNEEGVSLERIDPIAPTAGSDNWRSAAFGKATPGFRNSVFSAGSVAEAEVSVEPEIFSIGSGNEFTRIMFLLPESDIFSNVQVFDLDGRLIKEVADNQNLGRSGFIRWDGDRSDGRAVDPGMYVLTIDLYNDSGYRRRYRFRVVVVK